MVKNLFTLNQPLVPTDFWVKLYPSHKRGITEHASSVLCSYTHTLKSEGVSHFDPKKNFPIFVHSLSYNL